MTDLIEVLRNAGSSIERKLFFLGWLNRKLEELRVNDFPVLVGGSAVSFYTGGNYATQDIDLTYSSPRLEEVLLPAGFHRDGRYWVHEELDLLVECPGSDRPERTLDLELQNGDHVYISSVEDMIVDRLCAFAFWDSPSDAQWARLMLETSAEALPLDWKYLEKRAQAEDVMEQLRQIKAECEDDERGQNLEIQGNEK
jgi:hypothetical protein